MSTAHSIVINILAVFALCSLVFKSLQREAFVLWWEAADVNNILYYASKMLAINFHTQHTSVVLVVLLLYNKSISFYNN